MGSQASCTETVYIAANIFNEPRQITVSDAYDANVDVVLFDGDCGELLKNISSDSVDLVITSPPYNIGKKIRKKNVLSVISKRYGACNCRVSSGDR